MKRIFALVLTLMLSFGVAGSITYAENGTNNNGSNNNHLAATTGDNDDDDMDWGWIGLIGLVGLLGLRGRDRKK